VSGREWSESQVEEAHPCNRVTPVNEETEKLKKSVTRLGG
jgi:hypothetical protein